MAVHGAESLVEVAGRLHRCRLSGRMKHRRESSRDETRSKGESAWKRDTSEARGRWGNSRQDAPVSSPIAVGDNVVVRVQTDGAGAIIDRLERTTWLGRLRPHKGPQVIAANIEIALVVMSLVDPEPSYFLLDQFLVQAAAGGMEPRVVFNKVDLLTAGQSEPAAADEYRQAGYDVYCVSARSGQGFEPLAEALANRTSVLVGPSGVGKSHILNRLIPEADAEVGEISAWSGRGQHTTTYIAMYPIPNGGYLVDAPGIRRLCLWQVATHSLAASFPEFVPLSPHCKFQPCTHTSEERCAIREAAGKGQISPRRYQHYLEMRSQQ